MGRFRTFTILLALGTWGAATDGAPPDDATPTTQPALPSGVKPGDYVKAVVQLCNAGQHEEAARYYEAAMMFQNGLTPEQQATLEQYGQYLNPPAPAPAPDAAASARPDAAAGAPAPVIDLASAHRSQAISLVSAARQALENGQLDEARRLATQARDMNAPFAANEDNPNTVLADVQHAQSGPMGRGAPSNNEKQQAMWFLHQARENMRLGNFDAAREFLARAEGLNVKWSLFDDTPSHVRDDLAKTRLKDARAALNQGDYKAAEEIAREVEAWGHHFTIFEDSPQKILSASAAVQRRDASRNNGPMTQPNADFYKILVSEARQLMAAGNLDEAAERAQQAQRLNIVPEVTADRAEAVLNDVAMLKAGRGPSATASASGQTAYIEPASVKAEREANDLLAKNQVDAARAKFEEAERLRVQETGVNLEGAKVALVDPAAPADASVMQAQAAPDGLQAPVNNAAFDPNAMPVDPNAAPVPLGDPNAAPGAPLSPVDVALQGFDPNAMPAADPNPAPLSDPAPLADPNAVPALDVAPGAAAPEAFDPTAPVLNEVPASEPAPVAQPGFDELSQAQAVLAQGNFKAARQLAEQARAAGVTEADAMLADIALKRQQAAYSLYDSALTAMRDHDMDRSRAMLQELTGFDDLDEGMQQRVQDLLLKIPSDGAGHAEVGLNAVADAEMVQAQKLNVEVGTKVAEARRLLETDPEKAIKLLSETMTAVKAAGLSESVTKNMTRRVEIAVESAKKDKLVFDEKMKDKAYREQIERKRLRIIEADKAKKDRVTELMNKSMEAQANNNYLDAEKYALAAAQIDPNDVSAAAMVYKARYTRHYERSKQIKADGEESFLNQLHSADATGYMSQDLIERSIDPGKGFTELTRNRRALAARLAPKKPTKVLEIEKVLNSPITLPNSDRLSLGEAVKYISEYTGLNIMIDHKALMDEGVTNQTAVELMAVSNIKLKTVLKYMLRPLNLSYSIDDDVLLITSPVANRTRMYPVAYSVADLVISPHRKAPDPVQMINGMDVSNPAASNGSNDLAAQGAAMNGGVLPASVPGMPGTAQSFVGAAQKPEFEPLIQLIQTSIAPGTWSNNHTSLEEVGSFGQGGGFGGGGGDDDQTEGVGSITPFYLSISLIIRQTAEVHDEIVDLLRQLRRLQDLQVSIEVRFITVTDNFFEQIGVDFDFAIQSDAVGKHSSFAIPNPAAQLGGNTANSGTGTTGGTASTAGTASTSGGTPAYLINPIRDHAYGRKPLIVGTNGPTSDLNNPQFQQNLMLPFIQDTFTSALGVTNAPAPLALGGTFGLAFLSDLEVYLFMQAIQGDVRSNIVQAPKVTSFNGAPAMVMNQAPQYYVASLTPVVGFGAVAFQPQVTSFPNGVTLNVTPVVSADRRYVRMSMSPMFITLGGFTPFTIPAAVGGGGLGGQSSSIAAQIQEPNYTITMISTTVTVPDGGTVLLGGVKTLREERREYGVPILAKTPLINRLFRNIGIGRETTSLMLMVTPRIIILEEEEERLGVPEIQNVTF